MNVKEWDAELAYIANMTELCIAGEPPKEMNGDIPTALRYCAMQANTARRDGFPDIAAKIEFFASTAGNYELDAVLASPSLED